MNKEVTDKQLDYVYDLVDGLMRNGQWVMLAQHIQWLTIVAQDHPLDLLLAYATASFPAKTKITTRVAFMNRCKELHPDPELWRGLD